MSNIIGTTVNIRNFFDSTKRFVIKAGHIYDADHNNDSHEKDIDKISFEVGRKYIIPQFQREIRWEAENVKVLINDLESRSEFLGNIILNTKKGNFEIIDGQQRITVLLMIIDYIQKNIPDKNSIDIFTPCEIELESFTTFKQFRERDYGTADSDLSEITSAKNDKYLQSDRYSALWRCIQDFFSKQSGLMERIFNHLYDCEINLLIFESESNPKSAINHFLDVNQKGVKLDDEDILKGYLFQYNAAAVSARWIAIKQHCCWVNKNGKYYSLMLLFEQYFYTCRNLLYDSSSGMPDIKKDLTLRAKWEDNPSGTHLIVALKNRANTMQHLERMEKVSEILEDISVSTDPTFDFLGLFSDGVQYDTKRFIFYLCKSVLLSKNELPKAYLIKYILDNFIEGNERFKNRDSIKVIYIYTLLFNLFSDITKKRENVYKFARQENWVEELSGQINKYFNSTESTFVKNNAFVNLYNSMEVDPNNNRRDSYDFKAFACVYNFLNKTQSGLYSLGEPGEQDELYEFISNGSQYSLEHFLLNGSKKYVIENGTDAKNYPKRIGKYIGGLFNFIYVPKRINSDILKDYVMPAKVEILRNEGRAYERLGEEERLLLNENPIKCPYSKMVIELLSQKGPDNHHIYFDGYWNCYNENDESKWSSYFSTRYEEEYSTFAEEILRRFENKFKRLKNGESNEKQTMPRT